VVDPRRTSSRGSHLFPLVAVGQVKSAHFLSFAWLSHRSRGSVVVGCVPRRGGRQRTENMFQTPHFVPRRPCSELLSGRSRQFIQTNKQTKEERRKCELCTLPVGDRSIDPPHTCEAGTEFSTSCFSLPWGVVVVLYSTLSSTSCFSLPWGVVVVLCTPLSLPRTRCASPTPSVPFKRATRSFGAKQVPAGCFFLPPPMPATIQFKISM
jgi:hypothetical protein